MPQLTVRNASPELSRRLKELAARRGVSVNTLVLRLLELATGLSEREEHLARYATWSEEDQEDFERALAAQRQLDAEVWADE